MTVLHATARPEELVPGDEAGLEALGTTMRRYGEGCAQAEQTLRGIERGQWVGEAADVFREHVEELPAKLGRAATAFTEAGRVLDRHVDDLRDARTRARRAVELYADGEQASDRWRQDRTAHREAVARLEAQSAGLPVDPLAAGLRPPSAVDPGAEQRARAQRVLEDARADVDHAARQAAAAIRAAAELAPDEPGLLSQAVGQVGQFLAGAGEALYGLAEFAFKLSPVYLLIDPEGFVENAVGLGQGLWYGIQHPVEFGKALLDWDTWAENPARALGHLVPDLLLALATGGAGTALARTRRATEVLNDLAASGRGVNRLADAPSDLRASWAQQFGDPAAKASSDQRSGKYNGVDDWAQGWLEPGARFNSGSPGPSRYVAPEHVAGDVGLHGQRYWEGLQVSSFAPPGMSPSYRPGLVTYEVVTPMPVGVSLATHNPQFGSGGLPQYFLPGNIPALESSGHIALVDRVALSQTPPTIAPSGLPGVDPLTSASAGQHLAQGAAGAAGGLGAQAVVELQGGDR